MVKRFDKTLPTKKKSKQKKISYNATRKCQTLDIFGGKEDEEETNSGDAKVSSEDGEEEGQI